MNNMEQRRLAHAARKAEEERARQVEQARHQGIDVGIGEGLQHHVLQELRPVGDEEGPHLRVGIVIAVLTQDWHLFLRVARTGGQEPARLGDADDGRDAAVRRVGGEARYQHEDQ